VWVSDGSKAEKNRSLSRRESLKNSEVSQSDRGGGGERGDADFKRLTRENAGKIASRLQVLPRSSGEERVL